MCHTEYVWKQTWTCPVDAERAGSDIPTGFIAARSVRRNKLELRPKTEIFCGFVRVGRGHLSAALLQMTI